MTNHVILRIHRLLPFVLVLGVVFSGAVFAATLGNENPEHVVLGLVDNANTSAAITWRTSPAVTGTVVEYWAVDAPDARNRVTGISQSFDTNIGAMQMHKSQLTGLIPGVTYEYRVGDGTEERWSATLRFSTLATERTKPVSILVLSDTQSSPGRYNAWGDALQWALTDEYAEDLIVLPGDIVDYGGDQEEWEQWFTAVTRNNLSKIPVLPVVGNHDLSVSGRGSNKGEYLRNQFQVPTNGPKGQEGLVYSLDFGDVHIVVQNSEARSSADIEAQKRFLVEDLAKNTAKWTVVFMHRPLYESVRSWGNSYLEAYADIWEQYDVDVVVTGHDHVYMRTYPMRNGVAVQDNPLDLSQGIVYVTAGRAGSKGAPSDIYQPEQAASWQRLSGPNYVNLIFSQDELRVISRYTTWRIMDDVVLRK